MGILGPLAGRWRRGRARSAVRAALAIALLCWAAPASAQAPGPREVELDIVAGEDWAATGIDVRPGDSLSMEAGEATLSGDPMSPDGLADISSDNVIEPKLPYAALIGRIGGGPVFLVGARYEDKMTAAGPLQLRWNLRLLHSDPTHASLPAVYVVYVRHTPVRPPDPKEDKGNPTATDPDSSEENVPVAKAPVEAVVQPRAPPRRSRAPGMAQRDGPSGPAPSLFSAAGSWLLGLAILLLAAGAGGLALRRGARARRVERTRATLGVSPSLDLAEGRCGDDDLPAEGPAASLRARLDEGIAHEREGSGHG